MAVRTDNLPPVQKASKLLLGGAYSLEIGAWIYEFGGSPINPTQLREALATYAESPPKHASVVAEINNLEAAGLLKTLAVPGRDVYFERQSSVYFACCAQLRDEARNPVSLADQPPTGSLTA